MQLRGFLQFGTIKIHFGMMVVVSEAIAKLQQANEWKFVVGLLVRCRTWPRSVTLQRPNPFERLFYLLCMYLDPLWGWLQPANEWIWCRLVGFFFGFVEHDPRAAAAGQRARADAGPHDQRRLRVAAARRALVLARPAPLETVDFARRRRLHRRAEPPLGRLRRRSPPDAGSVNLTQVLFNKELGATSFYLTVHVG